MLPLRVTMASCHSAVTQDLTVVSSSFGEARVCGSVACALSWALPHCFLPQWVLGRGWPLFPEAAPNQGCRQCLLWQAGETASWCGSCAKLSGLFLMFWELCTIRRHSCWLWEGKAKQREVGRQLQLCHASKGWLCTFQTALKICILSTPESCQDGKAVWRHRGLELAIGRTCFGLLLPQLGWAKAKSMCLWLM